MEPPVRINSKSYEKMMHDSLIKDMAIYAVQNRKVIIDNSTDDQGNYIAERWRVFKCARWYSIEKDQVAQYVKERIETGEGVLNIDEIYQDYKNWTKSGSWITTMSKDKLLTFLVKSWGSPSPWRNKQFKTYIP